MRGKRDRRHLGEHQLRITPAHAGKTRRDRNQNCGCRDHPRACGENDAWKQADCRCRGSPPRMRGKRRRAHAIFCLQGITPAHAGKTPPSPHPVLRRRDHPRACGENPLSPHCPIDLKGSPPRMRGKHFENGVFPWLILVLSLNPL